MVLVFFFFFAYLLTYLFIYFMKKTTIYKFIIIFINFLLVKYGYYLGILDKNIIKITSFKNNSTSGSVRQLLCLIWFNSY